jgi:hypothetical protein
MGQRRNKMLRKGFSVVLVLITLLALGLVLTACESSTEESALYGRWEATVNNQRRELEFFSDGTVVESWSTSTRSGTWRVDGNRLSNEIVNALNARGHFNGVWTFRVTGNTLILDGNRGIYTLIRIR